MRLPPRTILRVATVVLVTLAVCGRPSTHDAQTPNVPARTAAEVVSGIPSDPMHAPAMAVPDAFNDSTPLTLVVSYRANRAQRHLIIRASFEGAELAVSAPDGRIPTFSAQSDAEAFATRMARPPADRAIAAVYASLGASTNAPPMLVDLDAVYAWSQQPSNARASPTQLVNAWSIIAASGELPQLPAPDPMWMAFPQGEGRTAPLDPDVALRVAAMKLHMVVRETGRRAARAADVSPFRNGWPLAEILTDAEIKGLANVLGPAVRAFNARLKNNSPDLKRAIRDR